MLAAGQSRLYSTSGTIFLLFVQQTCQNTARTIEKAVLHLFTKCMDGLFHKLREWCIKYGAIRATEKLLQSSKLCINVVFLIS